MKMLSYKIVRQYFSYSWEKNIWFPTQVNVTLEVNDT